MAWGSGKGGAPAWDSTSRSDTDTTEAAVFLLKDVSASMGPGQHLLTDTVYWRFEETLADRYDTIETGYLLFGSVSEWVDRETFYGPSDGYGGCGAVKGLEMVRERARDTDGDLYLVMAGDGYYAKDMLYDRLAPVEPDGAAHLCVYAEQDEGVVAFRPDLDERWAYDGVVTGPDDLGTVHTELASLVDRTLER